MIETGKQAVRWWPVPVMVGVFAAAIGLRLLVGTPHRQTIVLFTVQASLLLAVGMGLWFFVFSRFSRSTKGVGFILLGIQLLIGFMLFELDGFTGDMMPVLRPRGMAAARVTGEDVPSGMRGDVPGFRGPNRDGTVPSISLADNWHRVPPLLVWRRPVGAAWSSFAVAGRHAVTLEQDGEDEAMVCYDIASGDERWRVSWPGRFDKTPAGIGPRSTPSIANGRVVGIGALGHVACVTLETGRPLWSAELSDIGKGSRTWGYAASPLIVDGNVICVAGGKGDLLVAYELASGKVSWSGGSSSHHYSSPMMATLAGERQVLLFARNQLMGLAYGTGETLWQTDWPEGSQCVAQPLLLPRDRVMVSSGYGVGAAVVQVASGPGGFSVEEQWFNNKLKAKFSSMVLHQGLVYGLDDGILVCIEPESGERVWKRGRYGHGHLLLVGDVLIIQAESGEVARVDVPEGVERTRFRALTRRTWNPAVLSGNQLLVRNDKEAACFLLPLR